MLHNSNKSSTGSNFQLVWPGRHTGVLQEFLKHAITDYIVRSTDLFSIKLSNLKKMTRPNTSVAVLCDWIKIIPIFVRSVKNTLLECHRILVISLCVPWDEKGWKSLLYGFEKRGNSSKKHILLYFLVNRILAHSWKFLSV